MKAMGFQRTGSATATWRQPVDPDGIDPRHLFVATHIGSGGFDVQAGGWFTIELWVSPSEDAADPRIIGRPASYYDFMSTLDKAILLPLVNQARAVIPNQRALAPERELTTDVLWYYNSGHIGAYALVLRDMLPHILTVFALTRNIPPPPEVTNAL